MAAGIIKQLDSKERSFYTAKDVMELMDVSRDKAYRMIRELQEDMKKSGKMGKGYPQGKAPKWLFDRYYMLVDTKEL